MSIPIFFPFAAVVGQEDVKEALLIALTNPKAGGVLVSGEKGTAKSSLVRSLAQVAPDKKIITLPLNATEDMVFGHIDLEGAVTKGKKMFFPGILSQAHQEMLYIDEVNLMRQEVLTSILNTADRGVNIVEREGLSYQHDADFCLIGTMNPEEGTLSAPVLDRFGLFTSVSHETNAENRVEIIRRVLSYEKEPAAFCRKYQLDTLALIEKIELARKLCSTIEVTGAMMELAAKYAEKAHAAGHRAEIFLLEAAKAIAALAERNYLLPSDLERAAFFVLPHRMRQEESTPPQPQENENDTNEPEEKQEEQPSDEEMPPNNNQEEPSAEADHEDNEGAANNEDRENQEQEARDKGADEEHTADIDKFFSNVKLKVTLPKDREKRTGSGKRSLTRTDLNAGRYVRSIIPQGKLTDLAFDATIRAAAPYQRLRAKGKCCITILQEDLRQKVREKRIGNTFLFVVDASGSMGARERMRAVKGAIFSLLQDAYQKRDQVGLIAFRRTTAEVLLPITRSVDLAQKCLQTMPTGGKTPLAEGLAAAFSLLTSLKKKEKEMEPIMVLVTDGRANYSQTPNGDAVAEAVKMAGKIRDTAFSSVVIDTETDFIKLGVAKTVAREMGASCYSLRELSGKKILHIIKNLK